MRDFLSALALMLVMEGLLYAAFPDGMKRILAAALEQPTGQLRLAGLALAVVGLLSLWAARQVFGG